MDGHTLCECTDFWLSEAFLSRSLTLPTFVQALLHILSLQSISAPHASAPWPLVQRQFWKDNFPLLLIPSLFFLSSSPLFFLLLTFMPNLGGDWQAGVRWYQAQFYEFNSSLDSVRKQQVTEVLGDLGRSSSAPSPPQSQKQFPVFVIFHTLLLCLNSVKHFYKWKSESVLAFLLLCLKGSWIRGWMSFICRQISLKGFWL